MGQSTVLVVAAVVGQILLLGLAIAAVLMGRRVNRLLGRVFPQNPHLPALPDATELFRDDGQRIAVGVRRSALLKMLFWQIVALLGTGILTVVFVRLRIVPDGLDTYVAVVGLVFWVTLVLITLMLTVARLPRSGPALLITSDGIEDHASLIGTGLGLIRWHEIYFVFPMKMPRHGARRWRQLAITLTNRRAVIRRQPLWKRVPMLLYMDGQHAPMIRISDRYLTMSAEEMVERINDFVEAHAPPGWVWPGIRRFLEDEDEATEADNALGERDS